MNSLHSNIDFSHKIWKEETWNDVWIDGLMWNRIESKNEYDIWQWIEWNDNGIEIIVEFTFTPFTSSYVVYSNIIYRW